MKPRILVIEDDANIRDVCRRYMERDGYEVYMAVDGDEGWTQFQASAPDLIVIDVMIPRKDGYELCRDIREVSDVPLVMLTARGDERDRLMGLTLGADDYLTKPFSPRELMLRIHNIFRRVLQSTSPVKTQEPQTLEFPGMTIDLPTRRVIIDGHTVNLSVKEFDALAVMAKRPGQVFSKGQLLDIVWGYEDALDTNVVTVLIRRLREKIEVNPGKPCWVHTVWGIGYRFEPSKDDSREDVAP